VNPLEGSHLYVGDVLPGTFMVDDLGLIQADDGLGEGVVVAVTFAADGSGDTCLFQSLAVANGEVLVSAVAVDDQPLVSFPGVQCLFQCIKYEVGT
jgi:hypothetical protein